MEGWLRNLETAADIIYMHVSSDGGAQPRETSLKWQLLQIYKQHTQDNSPEQPGLDETAANGDGATDQSGLKRDVIENKRWWWSIIFHFRLESFGNSPPPLPLLLLLFVLSFYSRRLWRKPGGRVATNPHRWARFALKVLRTHSVEAEGTRAAITTHTEATATNNPSPGSWMKKFLWAQV